MNYEWEDKINMIATIKTYLVILSIVLLIIILS